MNNVKGHGKIHVPFIRDTTENQIKTRFEPQNFVNADDNDGGQSLSKAPKSTWTH